MRPNTLRALKAAGTPILNAWLSIPSAFAAEIVAHGGFNAVTVDCQHGLMGYETAVAMMQAIATTDAIPLVRPSQNEPAEIMRLLDGGAYGLICPLISTRAQAEAFVAACRYPPLGGRSIGPARGLLYGGPDYLAHANDEILALAMIETAEGLENLEAIVATPGLDGIYVGPNDLAMSLGRTPVPESDDPVVVEAIARIQAAVAAAGKLSGIFCSGGPGAARRLREGFDLVTPGNDAGLLKAALAQAVAGTLAGR